MIYSPNMGQATSRIKNVVGEELSKVSIVAEWLVT